MVALGVLAILSALIAGVTTCTIVVEFSPTNKFNFNPTNEGLGLGLGLLTVVVVLGLFFYAMVRVYRSLRQEIDAE